MVLDLHTGQRSFSMVLCLSRFLKARAFLILHKCGTMSLEQGETMSH